MLYKVSACICTRNRPDDLKKALDSLERSSYPILEVIVSDDSTNSDTQVLVQSFYPNVKYLSGPRRGLGANRNHAIEAVTGSHVFFIDDDVILGEDFLKIAFDRLNACVQAGVGKRENIIVTGIENQGQKLIFPQEQNFIGYKKISYRKGEAIKTVVINSTVFPRSVFKKLLFDEKIVCGGDEIDFTTRAVKEGFKIVLCPQAVNLHFSSPINQDYYQPAHEASRLYVTFKRYFSTDKKRKKALAYLAIASAHTLAHAVKVEGLGGFFKGTRAVQMVGSYLIQEYFLKKNTEKRLVSRIETAEIFPSV